MVYLDVVMVINFLVDLLLLMGTNRLSGFPLSLGRTAMAALIGGVYGGVCLIRELRFLANPGWRLVFLGLMSAVAFGLNRTAVRRGILFMLLSMALGGIALTMGKGGVPELIAAAAGIAILCAAGVHGKVWGQKYEKVVLRLGDRRVTLTALQDTGNTLRDPISGDSVMVVDREAAWQLADLTPQQLSAPIETVAMLHRPGLRLIPYRSVGRSGGMLLAMRMDEVLLGGRKVSTLVAFTPDKIGGAAYQALTGGVMWCRLLWIYWKSWEYCLQIRFFT